jgi:hypothetical protein
MKLFTYPSEINVSQELAKAIEKRQVLLPGFHTILLILMGRHWFTRGPATGV